MHDFDIALVAWRAIHFIATVQLTGLVAFVSVVLRGSQLQAAVERRLKSLYYVSLALSLISSAGWALMVARAIDDTNSWTAINDGTALSILRDTQFGNAWFIQFLAVFTLAIATPFSGRFLQRAVAAVSACVLAGSLAFAGHGASSSVGGDLHLAADILHLIAVACWVGGLLPYAIILSVTSQAKAHEKMDTALTVTLRYSSLASVCVIVILVTGSINFVYLVGGAAALVSSEYGVLLSLKIAIFGTMLAFAIVNRFVLTPRISLGDVRGLQRNALMEFALGAIALLLVAAIGTLPPPIWD